MSPSHSQPIKEKKPRFPNRKRGSIQDRRVNAGPSLQCICPYLPALKS